MVDLATLTGAVLVALGSTYAGADLQRRRARRRGRGAPASRTGELVWRLPLHPEYKELTKGTVADLTNASAKRKAGTIYAGSFLEEFVDDTPWAHLDIAGTAWDVGREYVGKGAERLRRAPAGRPGPLAGELDREQLALVPPLVAALMKRLRRGSGRCWCRVASSLPVSAAVSFASASACLAATVDDLGLGSGRAPVSRVIGRRYFTSRAGEV